MNQIVNRRRLAERRAAARSGGSVLAGFTPVDGEVAATSEAVAVPDTGGEDLWQPEAAQPGDAQPSTEQPPYTDEPAAVDAAEPAADPAPEPVAELATAIDRTPEQTRQQADAFLAELQELPEAEQDEKLDALEISDPVLYAVVAEEL